MRLLILLAMIATAGAANSAAPGTDLVAALKARDALFDDARLRYTTWGVMKYEAFPDWKFPGFADQAQIPRDARGPGELKVRYHEQLIVRGNEITFIRELDPALFPKELKPGRVAPGAYDKWSNTEGKVREITNSYPMDHPKRNMILEIRPSNPEGNFIDEQKMEAEFACGFGFGKRIKAINEIRQEKDGGLSMTGSIRIWTRDQSTFRLRMDRDHIVREAHIEARVGSVVNIIDVQTSGTKLTDKMPFASFGHYKRVMQTLRDGKPAGVAQPIRELNLEFNDIQYGLTPNEYAALTDMEVPDGTQIMDRVQNLDYHKGGKQKTAR